MTEYHNPAEGDWYVTQTTTNDTEIGLVIGIEPVAMDGDEPVLRYTMFFPQVPDTVFAGRRQLMEWLGDVSDTSFNTAYDRHIDD